MEQCQCDNCSTMIYFKENVWRNGDIFCSKCHHLYEDIRSAEAMTELTLDEVDCIEKGED